MFSLDETAARRMSVVRAAPCARRRRLGLAAARGAARRRGGGQAREPSADRRLQGARRPDLCRRADAARAAARRASSRRRAAITARASPSPARRFGLAVTIVVPHGNSREKNAAMRALGAELIEHGPDFQAAREEAMRLADERGPARRAVLPSRSRARRLDLRARAPRASTPTSTCSMFRSARARGSAAASRRATRSASRPRSSASRRPRRRPMRCPSPPAASCRTDSADTFADGMATRVPDEEALDVIAKGASRIVLVARRRDRRGDPRLLDRHAQSRRRRGRRRARRGDEGARAPRRPQGRARALGRQHRLRSLPTLGRGGAERRGGLNSGSSAARRPLHRRGCS